MEDLSQEETRAVYEISKLTNVTKQIMDDFNNAAVMAMFKEFITTYKQPELALNSFMTEWKENILKQKQEELEALSNQDGSMFNMVVGQRISEQEDFKSYIEEVDFIKEIVTESIKYSIK